MNQNNDVFQVLVGTGVSQRGEILDAGLPLSSLGVGQIGIFNADTNLSIDQTATPDLFREFFLAVGVDRDGDGVLDDVIKSHTIQRANVYHYLSKCYSAGQNWIFDLVDFSANCDTDYNVRMLIDSGDIRQMSTNQMYLDYFVHTGCCDECEECPSGDCVELAELLVDAVNNETIGVFDAVAIYNNTGTIRVTHAPNSAGGDVVFTFNGATVTVTLLITDTIAQATAKITAAFDALAGWSATDDGVDTVTLVKDTLGGADNTLVLTDADGTGLTVTIVEPAAVEVTDYDAFRLAHPNECLGVRFESNPRNTMTFCGINPNYVKIREYTVTPTLGDSFECNGTWITVQNMTMEEGLGYDVAWQEYLAGGWNGNPGKYRQSALHGLPKSINLLADETEHYALVEISSVFNSMAGFHHEYNNPINVTIALPCDSNELVDLLVVLDAMLSTAATAHGGQYFASQTTAMATCDCFNQ